MDNNFDIREYLKIPNNRPVELRICYIAELWYKLVLSAKGGKNHFDIINDLFPELVIKVPSLEIRNRDMDQIRKKTVASNEKKKIPPKLDEQTFYITAYQYNGKLHQGDASIAVHSINCLFGSVTKPKYDSVAKLIQERISSELCTNNMAIDRLRSYYTDLINHLSDDQKNNFVLVFTTYINTVVNDLGREEFKDYSSPLLPIHRRGLLFDLNNYLFYEIGLKNYANFFLWITLGALLRSEIQNLLNTYNSSFGIKMNRLQDVSDIGDADLPGYLFDELLSTYNNHQSMLLLNPDKSMFPQGIPKIPISNRSVYDEYQKKSYTVTEALQIIGTSLPKSSILIEGDGGIGKTLTLFDICTDKYSFFYRVPAIYIPLYVMNSIMDSDAIDTYIKYNFPAGYQRILRLSKQPYKDKPNLVLLLDGINEVAISNRARIERNIDTWSSYPGVLVIVSSRYQQSYEAFFYRYTLLPLEKQEVKSYLELCNVTLPDLNSKIWDVIKTPLYFNMYIQTDFMKNETKHVSYINWRESRNCGEILWNYMLLESYRTIRQRAVEKGSIPAHEYAFAICAIAPCIFHNMLIQNKSSLTMKELLELIDLAVDDYCSNYEPPQIVYSILYDVDHRARIRTTADDHLDWIYEVLVNNSVLFVEKNIDNTANKVFVPLHPILRDGYASIHLYNIANSIVAKKGSQQYPLELQRYQKEFIMQTFAELISNKILFELIANTKRLDHIIFANSISFLLECYGLKNDYHFEKIDFSHMDLRNLNLSTFKKSDEIRLNFPLSADKFTETKVSGFTFATPGHQNLIRVIKVSKSGNFFISASDDLTIKVWDMYSGICRNTLIGHTDIINDVMITFDDNYLISGSNDSTVRVWDINNSSSECLYSETNVPITCLSLSSDSQFLAAGSSNRKVYIWNLKDNYNLVTSYYCHMDEVSCIGFSNDNQYVISAGKDCMAVIYDLKQRQIAGFLRGHTRSIRNLIISDKREICITSSDDNTIRIWDYKLGICLHKLSGHGLSVTDMKLTKDNQFLVSISMDNTICLWDVSSGNQIYSIKDEQPLRLKPVGESDKNQKHWSSIIQLTPDSQIGISSSEKKALFRFDLLTGKQLSDYKQKLFINNIVVSPDGSTCVSSSLNDNTILIWDALSGKNHKVIPYNSDKVLLFSLSPNGRECLCLMNDHSIRICDLDNKYCKHIFYFSNTTYSFIGYILNGEKIICCDIKGNIRIFDTNNDYKEDHYYSYDILHTFTKRQKRSNYDGVWNVVNSDMMLAVDKAGDVYITNKQNQDALFYSPDESAPYCTAATEIGHQENNLCLALGFNTGTIIFCAYDDLHNNRIMFSSDEEIAHIFYRKDSNSLICKEKRVDIVSEFSANIDDYYIEDLPDGRLDKRGIELSAITLSTDNKFLCYGFSDSSIIVWDFALSKYRYPYKTNFDPICILEITFDNRFIICNKSKNELLVISLLNCELNCSLSYDSDFTSIHLLDSSYTCITSHDNGELIKWNVETGKMIEVLMKNQSGLDYRNIDLSKAIITSEKDLLKQNGIITDVNEDVY